MSNKAWKAAERRVSTRLKGRRIPVTGIDRAGADVVTPIAHVQVKHRRGRPSYLRDWLSGICADAKPHGKVGIVVWSEPGQRSDDAVVVMSLKQFEELYGPLVADKADPVGERV